jgi:hypothetical protein
MADAPKGPGPVGDLFFIIGLLLVLVALWFATGAYKTADLAGIFLHPPQPVGQGGAYGPTIGTTTNY